jgi:glucose/arabinose dehydrogenase
MIALPFLRCLVAAAFAGALALEFVSCAHAQAAPPAQTAGFALADQIRASRTSSTNRAVAMEQQAALDQQTQLAFAQAQQFEAQPAEPPLRVEATPDGGVVVEGARNLMGPGLVPQGAQIGSITLQINVQAGTGNVAGNSVESGG